MTKTILVAGYGPGISQAVAKKFAAQGFSVALVGRTAERLAKGASALVEAGFSARPFVCDLSDAGATRQLVREVSSTLGPIEVLHWNAIPGVARDLTTAPVQEIRALFDLGVASLVAAVQEALPELKKSRGAVLVTGGGLAHYEAQMDKLASEWNVMGLAVLKAAQHKLVGVLHHKLAADGVYVGEVTVESTVKGSAFDQGQGTLAADAVADAFWGLYSERKQSSVNIR
ncbi:MAG: Short-chain dehydrogenase/reductase [Myxococcaceae bacterium]|nr:Short-chain dehydrogenase/reductase [Myxococcaceae bacterium]